MRKRKHHKNSGQQAGLGWAWKAPEVSAPPQRARQLQKLKAQIRAIERAPKPRKSGSKHKWRSGDAQTIYMGTTYRTEGDPSIGPLISLDRYRFIPRESTYTEDEMAELETGFHLAHHL